MYSQATRARHYGAREAEWYGVNGRRPLGRSKTAGNVSGRWELATSRYRTGSQANVPSDDPGEQCGETDS